jgi:gamma-glutamylcysteine synthetase
VFDEGFGFEQYADYALDVPMYFVYRNGKYIDVAGQSFRDFLAGKLPGLPGEKPSEDGLVSDVSAETGMRAAYQQWKKMMAAEAK